MPSSDRANPGLPATLTRASLGDGLSRFDAACALQDCDTRLVPFLLRHFAARIAAGRRIDRSEKPRTAASDPECVKVNKR